MRIRDIKGNRDSEKIIKKEKKKARMAGSYLCEQCWVWRFILLQWCFDESSKLSCFKFERL